MIGMSEPSHFDRIRAERIKELEERLARNQRLVASLTRLLELYRMNAERNMVRPDMAASEDWE
jgi:uncharacterized coiled-coil protein SlyX